MLAGIERAVFESPLKLWSLLSIRYPLLALTIETANRFMYRFMSTTKPRATVSAGWMVVDLSILLALLCNSMVYMEEELRSDSSKESSDGIDKMGCEIGS